MRTGARCKGGGALKSETTQTAEFGSPQETFGMACLVQGNEGCFGRIRGGQHFIKTTLGEASTLTVRQAAASRSNCLSAAFAPPKKKSERTTGTHWPSQEALRRLQRYFASWAALLASATSGPRVLTIHWRTETPDGRALHGARRYSRRVATRPHLEHWYVRVTLRVSA